MKGTWLLAWRYVTYHRWRSLLLCLALALTVVLPITVQVLVARFERELTERADATPLVLGAVGSRYDLVLSSLYFRGRIPAPVTLSAAEALRATGLADAHPVLARNTAKGAPLVGVELDYFTFRKLVPKRGTLPQMLGDCVLGATIADELGLGPGDAVLSDQENLYDISKSYPLKMPVVGVLAPNGSPDDHAVFCDLATAWIVEGIGHGHRPPEEQSEQQRLSTEEGHVRLNASIVEYNEITPANAASFHFHATPDELPLTGVLVDPFDRKSRTLLLGRYRVDDDLQLLEPGVVVQELLGFVFRLKAFFDANALAVLGATILFLGTIVLLSIQVRRKELDTLMKIGAARTTLVRLVSTELFLLTLGGTLIAALLALPTLTLLLRQAGL